MAPRPRSGPLLPALLAMAILFGCGVGSDASESDAEMDSAAPLATGSLAWSNWECEEVNRNYCFAEYNSRYWIQCYPDTNYECSFGASSHVGAGDSCPNNEETGCESCETVFRECAAAWIAAGN